MGNRHPPKTTRKGRESYEVFNNRDHPFLSNTVH